ncbi:MAG TPA: hypothetical protein PLF26_15925 [Blastocatellia bacterium]|nr:hypothetical protein [Blastocatellia bacterium]
MSNYGLSAIAPRVLAIGFALFLSIFAADVFEERSGFWQTIGALLVHLLPAFLVLLVLALAWHRELVGGLVFLLLGALYLLFAVGRMHWSALVVVSGPLFAIGALFVCSWWFTRHAVEAHP